MEQQHPEPTTTHQRKWSTRNLRMSCNMGLQPIKKFSHQQSSRSRLHPPRFLKQMASVISSPLALLIQMSWQEGTLPREWKQSIIVPVPKAGSSNSPGDYRPIHLTCIMAKIAERFVLQQIADIIDHELPTQQFGFRKHRGTQEALIQAEYHIVESMEASKTSSTKVAVVSFDISKAFDSVSHWRLMEHLRCPLQLSLNARTWLYDFLIGRTQTIKVENAFSEPSTIKSGVPQGTVLGPILYNMATAGLKHVSLSGGTKLVLYADDLLLVKNIQSEEEESDLQKDCDSIADFYKSELLQLNGNKTRVMIVSVSPHGAAPLRNPLIVNGSVVQQVDSLKYLGIHFDERMSFTKHTNIVASKARKMLGAVGSKLRRWHMQAQIKKIFSCCIRPVLSYGCVVTYGKSKTGDATLERVIKTASRMALNSYADISYEELIKKVGWISLGSEAKQSQMKILFKNLTKIQERRTELFQSIEPETARRASRLSHDKQLKINGYQPHLARTKQAAIPTMVKLWNSLPPEVVNSLTIEEFTGKLTKTTL
jgi:hypothetical protein